MKKTTHKFFPTFIAFALILSLAFANFINVNAIEETEKPTEQVGKAAENPQDVQDPQGSQDSQDPQGSQDPQDPQDAQDPTDPQDSQGAQNSQGTQNSQDPQGSQDSQDPQGSQDPQSPANPQDPQDTQGTQAPQNVQDPQDTQDPVTQKVFIMDPSVTINPGATRKSTDGSAWKPQFTVTHDGKTLQEGTDYTIEYHTTKIPAANPHDYDLFDAEPNFTGPSYIWVTITGKGDYYGTFSQRFTHYQGTYVTPKPASKVEGEDDPAFELLQHNGTDWEAMMSTELLDDITREEGEVAGTYAIILKQVVDTIFGGFPTGSTLEEQEAWNRQWRQFTGMDLYWKVANNSNFSDYLYVWYFMPGTFTIEQKTNPDPIDPDPVDPDPVDPDPEPTIIPIVRPIVPPPGEPADQPQETIIKDVSVETTTQESTVKFIAPKTADQSHKSLLTAIVLFAGIGAFIVVLLKKAEQRAE